MCGIAGIIGRQNERELGAMLSAIEHRGRDNEGRYVSEPFGQDGLRVCLGHRRLAIIDTSSAANQPFFSEDGRFVVTYNGEIYNFREVREDLIKAGFRFRTDSDTEVLLNAFRLRGTECLDRLNGMFAFAVWDDQEKELTIARDRAGIKPVFYHLSDEGIVFASEIKAILASGLVEPELDIEGFDQFMTFLWPVPPRTMFRGISQVPPGSFLVWKNGAATVRTWWDLDLTREETGLVSESEWTGRVREALSRSVKMEMISDVPLGAFLSGGVDSSSIVALMSENSDEKVSVYTTAISKKDLRYDIIPDDVVWSRKVAELFPVDYHETIQTPDLASLLPKLVRHADAPVIDMAIPSYLISEQARKRQKVMLSGMGGDEIFAGYPRHLAMKLASMLGVVPGAIRSPLMAAVESLLPGGMRGRFTAPLRNAKKFAGSAGSDLESVYLGFGTYFTSAMKARIYSGDLRKLTADLDPYRHHRSLFASCRDVSPLNRLLYVDFKTFLPALNLDTTDRTSMAANLEVRVPFLNLEMLNLSEELPARMKLNGFKRKYVLKKAAESLLPKDVVWRKKAGFSAPVRSWLRNGLRPAVDDLLSESNVKKRGLFDPAEVRILVENNLSGREDHNLQVFQLLVFEIFMREFFD